MRTSNFTLTAGGVCIGIGALIAGLTRLPLWTAAFITLGIGITIVGNGSSKAGFIILGVSLALFLAASSCESPWLRALLG